MIAEDILRLFKISTTYFLKKNSIYEMLLNPLVLWLNDLTIILQLSSIIGMNSDTWKSNFGCFIEKFDHGFPSIIAKFLLYLTSVMRSTLKTIKKCDEKWRKSFLNLSSNSLLIWNFQNSEFEFQISEPTRLFRRQSVNWNRCSIFFHWTKKSLCWNLMKSSRDPCKTKKEAKVGSSTYTKVFWLSLFSVLDVVRP